jgi:hypothetical protein
LTYEDPVASALIELERCADEHMRADDSVDPPTAIEQPEPEPSLEEVVPEQRAPAGTDRAPVRAPRASSRGSKRNPTVTDFLVAGLALLVLAASVLGLLWLFRSE